MGNTMARNENLSDFYEPVAGAVGRMSFDELNDSTGFARGERFETEEEVRAYFTVENMESMFGCVECTPESMTEMADLVIRKGWHVVPGVGR